MSNETKPTTNLNFEEDVIAKIAGKTACSVDGVLRLEGNMLDKVSDRMTSGDDPTQGVNVTIDDDSQAVDIKIDAVLEYGKNAEQVFNRMTQKISNSVEEMTNLKVSKVDMTVQDMLTAEEVAERKSKKKNKEDH